MVVMLLPSTAETGITQERTACPSTCTVHAPHAAMPQAYLVPVMPSSSRSTHNNGISGSTSTSTCFPFTLSVAIACSLWLRCDRWVLQTRAAWTLARESGSPAPGSETGKYSFSDLALAAPGSRAASVSPLPLEGHHRLAPFGIVLDARNAERRSGLRILLQQDGGAAL